MEFMKVLSLAHEVVPETIASTPDVDIGGAGQEPSNAKRASFKAAASAQMDFIYQGPSPDEVTLVEFANELGFRFTGSTDQHIDLELRGLSQVEPDDSQQYF